jgi:hypothetical protein
LQKDLQTNYHEEKWQQDDRREEINQKIVP